ncbi:MFS transporter [Candidatus Cytomitobacter primus]|uniref:MFS transporter n=1 Tax=Candidatus Cytomitobacter primus TaxID=2066024 RepID=A0A5C0UFV4_9PROT|nr:MFS transporter [Candidatus Cytomitobacter primus]QEK38607.1 MFS transporter [Candidatus Cytomitobacter primus]
MTFAFLLGGFLISKFWQDTLMLSIPSIATYIGMPAAIIRQSVVFSGIGLTLGAMIVGPINDRFGPKKTFPVYLVLISILNIFLTYNLSVNLLRVVLLLRSVCLAGSINNTYVGTSLLYKGDQLPRMTSVLYMALFGLSALFPIAFSLIVKNYSFQVLSIISSIICLIISYYIFAHLPNKEPIPINFQTFKKWKNFLKDFKFIACSAVSMICIGGFYGFIAIYAAQFSKLNGKLTVNGMFKFAITLALIQGIGRFCTFITATMCSVKLNLGNVGKYLSLSMLGIAIGMFWMFISGMVFDKLILFGIFGFFLTCLASGIAQPATKLALLTIFKDSPGSGQSLVGTGNSVYEVIAILFVFNIPYQPLGGYLYLLLTSVVTFYLFLYFRKMEKI